MTLQGGVILNRNLNLEENQVAEKVKETVPQLQHHQCDLRSFSPEEWRSDGATTKKCCEQSFKWHLLPSLFDSLYTAEPCGFF